MLERIAKRPATPIKGHYAMAMAAVVMVVFLWACQHQVSAPSSPGDAAPSTLVQSPEAKKILEKHIEAIGGRRVLKRIYSRKAITKIIMPTKGIKLYAKETTYWQRPDKYHSIRKGVEPWGGHTSDSQYAYKKLRIRGKTLVEAGSDGRVVWIDGFILKDKATIQQGADRVNHLMRYAFDILQYETPYIGWELMGTEKIKGKPCYKLAITPHKGTPHYYFINKESLLVDKIAYDVQFGKKMELVEIIITHHKKIDGILMPYKYKAFRSDRLFLTANVESLETNIAIPADRFALPGAIQELARNQSDPDVFNYSPLKKQEPVTVSSKPTGRRRVVRTYYHLEGKKTLHEKYTLAGNIWHGPYHSYFPNGQVMIEERYIMDKIHGPSKHHDADGNLIQEENYHLGKLDGSQTFYCTDGTVKIKNNYRMGSQHGLTEIFYKCSGILAGRSFYDNGLLEGEKTAYYADGKIQEKTTYQTGEPHGMSIFYHANGRIAAQKRYAHGIKTGLWKYYYDSGRLKAEENYTVDQFHGMVKSYYPSGVLREETAYRNGLKHGIHQYFYKNSKLKDQVHYIDGKKSGIHKQYAWSGYLWLEESYSNDLLDGSTRHFNAKGKVIKRIYFKNGQQVDSPKGR